ncbi:T9SS type A sorting domain-containing protein [Empedobacter brevis]|uniref:T9SS type A sorting domain-containing protein n=1 Tax=Empedobacter brevis TaxID=247 RepID=UPI0039B06F9C
MKNKFTLLTTILLTSVAINAQTIKGEVTMGAAYANDVYYGLADQSTQVTNRADWDIAFYRKSNYATGIRINDGAGIELYEASNDFSTWNSIDVANIDSWKILYNSDINWQDGAFNKGSATYGWGDYNMANHYVLGKIIFVLKYATEEYVKIKIDNLAAPLGEYNFTYSKLVNGSWTEDKKVNLPHKTNPNNLFNYYSLLNDKATTPEPEQSKWDLKFTKYITPVTPNDGSPAVMYPVTGVLQSDLIKVAKTESGNPTDDKAYIEDINAIGYTWKSLSGWSYVVNPTNYFIKNTSTKQIYKLVFKTFEGSSTGKITFDYENVTASLGTTELSKTKFDIYTNPSQPKTITLAYNSQEAKSSPLNIQVFSMNGQLVHQETYQPTSSFSNKTIQLSKLSAGIYIVRVQNADKVESKKIVLK